MQRSRNKSKYMSVMDKPIAESNEYKIGVNTQTVTARYGSQFLPSLN